MRSGRTRLGVPAGGGLPAFALVLLLALAACTTAPVPLQELSAGDVRPHLRPLAVQPAVPAEEPVSRVPSVLYSLTGSGGADDEVPGSDLGDVFERGGASWYGIQFHQKRTANGERFDMGSLTAAHRTLPFNTWVCVRSLVNGREVLVRINDRGPYSQGRIIDLSQAAAQSLDMIGLGIKPVALSVMNKDYHRCAGLSVDPDQPPPVEPEPAPATRRTRAVEAPKTKEVPARLRR